MMGKWKEVVQKKGLEKTISIDNLKMKFIKESGSREAQDIRFLNKKILKKGKGRYTIYQQKKGKEIYTKKWISEKRLQKAKRASFAFYQKRTYKTRAGEKKLAKGKFRIETKMAGIKQKVIFTDKSKKTYKFSFATKAQKEAFVKLQKQKWVPLTPQKERQNFIDKFTFKKFRKKSDIDETP